MSVPSSTILPRSKPISGEVDFDGAAEILRAWSEGLTPDPDLTVSQWADRHRMLSGRASAEPGRYRTARTPYMGEIMDRLSPGDPTQRIVFMKAAQVGATEAGNNWIGFAIHQAPGPMLAVQPTVELAKRNSRQRIDPLIDESPELRERVKPARSRDAGNTMLSKEFAGGILIITGANSAVGLRSTPARYIFLDEVDAYPASADEEGDPVTLAEARSLTFAHRRKVFLVSTPTIRGLSRIEREFEASDQRRFFVPCPHCGAMQWLKFDRLRWQKGRPETAEYHCEGCETPIAEHHKTAMLEGGEWRATATGADPTTVGYHLSALYSPIGWLSWERIVRAWDAAQGSDEAIKAFRNTILGETWVETGEAPDWQRLYDRRERWPSGTVPAGGLFLTAGADVQKDRIEVDVWAWGRGLESWLVDHVVIEGGPDRHDAWSELTALLDRSWPHERGAHLRIARLAIDTGFEAPAVYLEATYLWWGEAANNPLSSVYGGRMVHVPECAAWTWDARAYPFFPALNDVWTDGANWRLGHWLTGRLGAVSLAALVRHLCLRAGLPEDRIDVTGLWGAVEGYAIGALESPRASITTLSRHFGFDAVETEGVIRFVMRGRASVAMLTPDDLVAAREGDVLELTRGQETELPQALKWQVARADEDYDAALVEARRITVDTTRIASESFPMAVPPEEAERRCRRALMEAWVGRETAAFRLPPSRLALDPADAIRLEHDGRLVDLRLVSIADAEARGIEAVRQDRATYDLPPGDPRAASLTRAVVFGAPDALLMDLPQLTEDQPAHRPLVAAHAVPWPGEIAVFRSPSTDAFELLTSFGTRARIGALVSDFYAGPTSRFDLGNVLAVDLLSGTLESVTDLTLFGGANALAIESAPGVWEIVQAGVAELLAPGRYRLTRLLRGQRGTENAMGNPAPAGARVVALDDSLASLPIAEADLGIPWNWRIGPASRPVSDKIYVAQAFTPAGVGLRPFSVAHVERPCRKPRAPGDLTIRWTRRSRALSADSWGGLDVPLAEELEAYEIEILDGVAVKRVLSTAITSGVYTAAQQTTDWGAPLGPDDSLTIRIFQLSALVGRGAPKTVTLKF